MRLQLLVLSVIGLMALVCLAQETERKPTVSKEPLTQEQVDIYRAVLNLYMKHSTVRVNLSDTTEPMDFSGLSSDDTCGKGIDLETTEGRSPVVHTLGPSVAVASGIVFVDPEQQERKIKEGDPENVIMKGKHTEEELHNSLKKAFDNGLLSLSEIAFDKSHLHAIVTYSFSCGRLCGCGAVLLLKKSGSRWKVQKPCVGWVS